jgi:small subunit ribosomal protein S20
MANTISSKKRVRQTIKRTDENRKARSRYKTFVKEARTEVAAKSKKSPELVKAAIAELAKAASKGLIHKKNAARKISRLQKSLNTTASK